MAPVPAQGKTSPRQAGTTTTQQICNQRLKVKRTRNTPRPHVKRAQAFTFKLIESFGSLLEVTSEGDASYKRFVFALFVLNFNLEIYIVIWFQVSGASLLTRIRAMCVFYTAGAVVDTLGPRCPGEISDDDSPALASRVEGEAVTGAEPHPKSLVSTAIVRNPLDRALHV